jgi:hypothetical protein
MEVFHELGVEEIISSVENMHHDRTLLATEGQGVTVPNSDNIVQLEATRLYFVGCATVGPQISLLIWPIGIDLDVSPGIHVGKNLGDVHAQGSNLSTMDDIHLVPTHVNSWYEVVSINNLVPFSK